MAIEPSGFTPKEDIEKYQEINNVSKDYGVITKKGSLTINGGRVTVERNVGSIWQRGKLEIISNEGNINTAGGSSHTFVYLNSSEGLRTEGYAITHIENNEGAIFLKNNGRSFVKRSDNGKAYLDSNTALLFIDDDSLRSAVESAGPQWDKIANPSKQVFTLSCQLPETFDLNFSDLEVFNSSSLIKGMVLATIGDRQFVLISAANKLDKPDIAFTLFEVREVTVKGKKERKLILIDNVLVIEHDETETNYNLRGNYFRRVYFENLRKKTGIEDISPLDAVYKQLEDTVERN